MKKRTGTTVFTCLLIVAEMALLSKSDAAYWGLQSSWDGGHYLVFVGTLAFQFAVCFIVNYIAASCVFFRVEFFRFPFESDKEAKEEAERAGKLAGWLTVAAFVFVALFVVL